MFEIFELEKKSQLLSSSFGKGLKQLRFFFEMTMDELSIRSGVSQSYISQLENDVRLPSDKIIKKIAKALSEKFFENEEKNFLSSLLDHGKLDTYLVGVEEFTFKIEEILFQLKKNALDRNLKIHAKNNDLSKNELELLKVFKSLDYNQQQKALSMIKLLKD